MVRTNIVSIFVLDHTKLNIYAHSLITTLIICVCKVETKNNTKSILTTNISRHTCSLLTKLSKLIYKSDKNLFLQFFC